MLRPIYLYPMALSFIVTGTAWKWFLNPGLGLDKTHARMGLGRASSSTGSSTRTWRSTRVVIAGVWQASGFGMAMFLAGLRGIDGEIMKAAQIDGARRSRSTAASSSRLLRPVFLSAFIVLAHMAIKSYDLVIALTGGGPGNADRAALDVHVLLHLHPQPDGASARRAR